MQVVLTSKELKPLSYNFLPNEVKLPISKSFFADLVEEIPAGTTYAAFWADGDFIAVNHWHQMIESLITWADNNGLVAMVSKSSARNAQVPFVLDWNNEKRNRGLTKICFMYAMSKADEENRYQKSFEFTRKYILEGTPYPGNYWRHSPILQWNGPKPGEDPMKDKTLTYLLAALNINNVLYSLIWITRLGLFAFKLTSSAENALWRDCVTIYLLQKNQGDKYELKTEDFGPEEVQKFKESIIGSNQLE